MADSLGKPLRFAPTAGQAGDAPEAIPLLVTVSMSTVEAVLADRSHDSDPILVWIAEQNAVPVIPPQPSRAGTGKTDWYLRKKRAAPVRQAEALPPRLQPLRQTRQALSRIRTSRRRSYPVAVDYQQSQRGRMLAPRRRDGRLPFRQADACLLRLGSASPACPSPIRLRCSRRRLVGLALDCQRSVVHRPGKAVTAECVGGCDVGGPRRHVHHERPARRVADRGPVQRRGRAR